jgi:DNA-binding NtrC family response regulator
MNEYQVLRQTQESVTKNMNPANDSIPRPILVAIDDDPQSLGLLSSALEEEIEVIGTTDPVRGLELVRKKHPEIVCVDVRMPQMNGMEVLEQIGEIDPGIRTIIMTGFYSTESAVEAIKRGAFDYFEKPISISRLRQVVQGLIDDHQKRARSRQLERDLLHENQFEGMVGRSPLMLEVFGLIRRIAPHYRNVLVTGETGTGKELVARALHRQSPVSSGPFAVCNCSAVVETLFESELFGHVKGSFTGATQDKIGLFEYANGGTVFLDEIGDMPLTTQAKILRVLQNQEVQRVGSPAVRRVDVRVIAATNRNLKTMVAEGKFREDLYYRLGTVEIRVPRLVEHREDLPLLFRHFLERFAKDFRKPLPQLTGRAEAVLTRYPWPGNIRELENALASASMMVQDQVIDVADLPESLRRVSTQPYLSEQDDLLPLEEVTRRHILQVLDRVKGNKVRAAEILGIGRTSLYRFLNGERVGQETVTDECSREALVPGRGSHHSADRTIT